MDKHSPKVWTYDDLEHVEYDGRRIEILDGVLYIDGHRRDSLEPAAPIDGEPVLNAPRPLHQWVLGQAFSILRALEGRGEVGSVWFAPLDVVLAKNKVFEPDIIVLRRAAKTVLGKKNFDFVPDLVVEVLSPSNRKHDRTRKRRFYARNRIPEYWIVDPEESSVEVLVLDDGALAYRAHGWYGPGDRVKSATFDIELAVDDIFPPPEDDEL